MKLSLSLSKAEPQNEDINRRKIITVKDTIHAVATENKV